MSLWFTEKQTRDLSLSCYVHDVFINKKSDFQQITVLDTGAFGRMLVLDGYIQTSEKDEFIYHEMIVHVPLVTHPYPRRVLIIGGGDGGTAREVLKHKEVEKVTMVEIDREVIEVSKRYLPSISCALSDSRLEVLCEDGLKYLPGKEGMFDVIIVDSTEPIGPSAVLFGKEFYKLALQALTEEGILVAQTESPFYNGDLIASSYSILSDLFPVLGFYLAPVPSYPGGLWSFTMGSRKHCPHDITTKERARKVNNCRYYSPDIHHSAFILPPFVSALFFNAAGKSGG